MQQWTAQLSADYLYVPIQHIVQFNIQKAPQCSDGKQSIYKLIKLWLGNWTLVLKKQSEISCIVLISVFHINPGVCVQHPFFPKPSEEEKQKKRCHKQETAGLNFPSSWRTIPTHLLWVIWEEEKDRKLMKNETPHSVQITCIIMCNNSEHYTFVFYC